MLMYMFLRKRPGCALIGACALIRTNTVYHDIISCACLNDTAKLAGNKFQKQTVHNLFFD